MKLVQHVVLLVNQPKSPWDIWKGGNMVLDRFCIDEEMAIKSSGVFSMSDWLFRPLFKCKSG